MWHANTTVLTLHVVTSETNTAVELVDVDKPQRKNETYTSIRCACSNFVTTGIPTDFKNATCSFVTMNKLSTLKNKVCCEHIICYKTFHLADKFSSVPLTCVDQMWTHLSKLPDARNLPSGENATLYTGSVCLVSV